MHLRFRPPALQSASEKQVQFAGSSAGRKRPAGTAAAELKTRAAEALQKAEGLTVIDAGDILSDPESVRKVRTADAVVLVECKNVSSMADIERETELLKTMGVKLEGFILA